MNITVNKGRLLDSGAELLVVPVIKDRGYSGLQELGADFVKRIDLLAKAQEFTGESGQTLTLPAPANLEAHHLVLVGLGEKKRETLLASFLELGNSVIQLAKKLGVRTVAIDLGAKDLQLPEFVEAVSTGALTANYAFDVYKKDNSKHKVGDIDLLVTDGRAALNLRKSVERATIVGEGVTIARDLVNVPAHDMTPERLAQAAEEIAKASDKLIKVKVLDRAACAKLGMNAFLAVAQGAEREPKLIHLTYTSPKPTKKTVAIVGKGVTFDSGGLSLKPADSMMTMKCDMSGAAAVLGLFATLSKLKPRVNLHGVIAATENMPSGNAIRPGDIIKSMSGKTIEILNTDAEGRLTLADAFTYILREKPDQLVDLATLTGACVVALGEEVAGIMSNDRALARSILNSAKSAGEKLWELPLPDCYRSQVKSDVADLRNIATNRWGGSLTAGLFLQEFVGTTPWAHLDIAGPAFAERPFSIYQKGATGYGVRTLVDWVAGE